MNRFWILIAVLFSMNLTAPDLVNGDDDFFKGYKQYKKGIDFYEEKKFRDADESFGQAIKFLELTLKQGIDPQKRSLVHLYLGISQYQYTRGDKKEAAKSLKLALDEGSLDSKEQAQAYFYWGMSLLAGISLGKDDNRSVQAKFEEALKHNPNLKLPTWLEGHEAENLLKTVREAVTGRLTLTLSPSESKNWVIQIDEKRLDKNDHGAVVSRNGLRLYKGQYTVKGIYKGKSVEGKITIEPNRLKKYTLNIGTVDNTPRQLVY